MRHGRQMRREEPSLTAPFEFRTLTPSQLDLLHESSLDVLWRTGLRFHHQEALALFRNAGADVSDGNLVRIPSRLVEWALECVPKSLRIYDREGKSAMWLGGRRSYVGVGSDCMYVYDLDTGLHRRAVLADVERGVRLVDALPNIDFVMSMFMPEDAPDKTYEMHQMAIMLRESRKPIIFVGISLASTIYAIEMAACVAGGVGELARKPFVINYVNPSTSFQHDEVSVARLLYAAERNLPTIYSPGCARGSTAPMTVAGAMVAGNAGQLAGMVLSQLKREGSPYIRTGSGGGGVDMRTMVSLYAAPDPGMAAWELNRRYGVPTFGIGGCSDAKVFDAQAAGEAALTLYTSFLGGVNLIHDVGYLDCAMTGSLELIAYCDEVTGWIRRLLRPLDVTQETLALDLIDSIAPDGTFLEAEHTLTHCRDVFTPALADRQNFSRWSAGGGHSLQERAKEQVRQLLDSHRCSPLPGDVLQELAAIVARVDSSP